MRTAEEAFRASVAVDARLSKASFGGDRSAAGRYAAEQRWKGHHKNDISDKVAVSHSVSGEENRGTVWATDKETGKVIGALEFNGQFIGKVYVLPDYRRKGVASLLYVEAKKHNGGVEMRADDYTNSGAGFMSAATGKDIYQSGDYSEIPPEVVREWRSWLKGLEAKASNKRLSIDLSKASFGGDRSAAGRYAAEQRWKGHTKLSKPKTPNLGESVLSDTTTRHEGEKSTKRIVEVQFSIGGEDFRAKITTIKRDDASRYYLDREIRVEVIELKSGDRWQIGTMQAARGTMGAESDSKITIDGIEVDEDYQRRGIATAMLHLGRKYNIGGEQIHHSDNLTAEGQGFAAAIKASFGGDRSAAGRYAAQQRWKNHVKRQTQTGGNRSTDEQLSQGPKNLAFGRDENGLPIVGTRKELEARYGKTDKERAAYFKKKYGIKVTFADIKGQDGNQHPDAIEAKLGSLQALDDILSNLNVIPVGLTTNPPISEIRIGTENEMQGLFGSVPIGFVIHGKQDSRQFRLQIDTAECDAMAMDLIARTLPVTEQEALMDLEDDSPVNLVNLRREEETGGLTIASRFGIREASRDKTKQSREDEQSVVRRLGYAIMVHEWGHVLDTQSFFDSEQRTRMKDYTSDRLEEDDSPAWRETPAVSEYGRFRTWEKMAEGFSAWFLFSQSTKPVLYYSPKTNVYSSEASRWLKNQEVLDVQSLISPTLRPLFDSLRPPQTSEQVLKQVGSFVTTVADLPFDHPVVVFALQPFADDGVEKARPENPWKRGYNTEYFRVRDAVLARKPLCYKCRKNRAVEVDHVRPLINGGSNTVGNLRPICRSCNRKSGGGERRVRKSVRVDAMVQLAFDKASFGGDRSAAGRYAAEQRWKGHVKGENRHRSKKDNRWGPDRRIAGQYSFIERKWEIDKMPALEGISTEVLYRLATNFDNPFTSVVMGAGSASVDSLDQLRESGKSNTNNLELALPPKDDRTAIVHAIVVGIFRNWESDASTAAAQQAKRAVKDEFGLTDAKEPTYFTSRGAVDPLPPDEYEALKAVLKAVYQRTQMHLADTGLREDDTVTVFRATGELVGARTTVDYQSAPLTSFTRLREVADDWESGKAVFTAKVPRTKVFFINNVFLHGGWMGEENEVILLGGKIEVGVSEPKPKKRDEDE